MMSCRNNIKLILELIETLWNVNIFSPCQACIAVNELIETLWNVNEFRYAEHIEMRKKELIETLWNVNDDLERVWVNTPHLN